VIHFLLEVRRDFHYSLSWSWSSHLNTLSPIYIEIFPKIGMIKTRLVCQWLPYRTAATGDPMAIPSSSCLFGCVDCQQMNIPRLHFLYQNIERLQSNLSLQLQPKNRQTPLPWLVKPPDYPMLLRTLSRDKLYETHIF